MSERAEAWADAEARPCRQGTNAGGLLDDEIAATEENRTYPPSVQPGIPKLGVAPAGWRRIRLKEVLELVSRPATMAENKRYQLVTAKRNRGGIVPREILFGHQIKTKTQSFIEAGDFLISRRQIAHGACGIVPKDLHGAIVSNEYSTLRAKKELDHRFLKHLTHSVYFQQTCFHSSIGVHVEKLVFKLDEWLEWEFDLPRLEEQWAIADALDAWDRAIETTKALVDARRRRYRAFVLRFSREFHDERMEFGKLARPIFDRMQPDGLAVPVESIELESIESNTGRILGTQIINQSSAIRFRFMTGDILFGRLRPYLRKFARVQTEGICSTEIWVFRANQDLCDPDILFFLVQTQEFQAAAETQSGSRMPRADWDYVSMAPVPLPSCLNVQRQAAKRLRDAFAEIEPLARYLDRLKTQKAGLMQKLLSGDWRLSDLANTAPAKVLDAG